MEKGGTKWMEWSKGTVSMVMVQVIATAMQLLAKIVLNNGTFVFALMAYRHIVAAFCVAPFAFLFERDITTKLSWSVFFWLFLNSLTGISMPMALFYYGLRDTSAAYAVNFLNLIPICTFVLSILLGIEKVKLGSKEGKMKSVGAVLCVGGAFTSFFYKGKSFFIFHKYHHLYVIHQSTRYLRGTLSLVASCLCYAFWYILQVKLSKVFPFKYWATMLTCVIASVQSIVIGLLLDATKAAWQLHWNLQLLTILYSGAFGTAATYCMIVWAVVKWGPTYPSMFNPITLVFVALLEALVLGSPLNLSSLVGMIVIIVGLYVFLFGRRTELLKLSEVNEPNVDLSAEMMAPQKITIVTPKTDIKL